MARYVIREKKTFSVDRLADNGQFQYAMVECGTEEEAERYRKKLSDGRMI